MDYFGKLSAFEFDMDDFSKTYCLHMDDFD